MEDGKKRKIGFTWESLRALQSIKFISSMYLYVFLVPIVVKTFSKIEEYANFRIWEQSIQVHLSLPFSWKAFSFCAVAFGVANLLTIMFLPKIIKDHLSLAGFLGDGKFEDHLRDYGENVGVEYKYFQFQYDDSIDFKDSERRNKERHQEHIRNWFWSIYNGANEHRLGIRVLASICYGIGFILFGAVLLSNLIWVIKYLMRTGVIG